jgi:primosomal protein N' (replication factor Y)
MVMSVPEALHSPKPSIVYQLKQSAPDVRMTPARRRVLDVLTNQPPRPATELAREAGVSVSVIKGMVNAGVIRSLEMAPEEPEKPDWRQAGPNLSRAQSEAASQLRASVGNRYSVTVLDGVPGAGKTEVYFEAIAEALKQGYQVLVLLPEIALGAQWLARFRARFGAQPAQWHSDLSRMQRRRTWRAVADGTARVVVGARSALFLPYHNLGLIVVDEEHDPAFKQDDGVAYHARDMAVVRAYLGEIPIVLVSATPSLETTSNVTAGRYGSFHLPDRHGGAVTPDVTIIDLRKDGPPRGRWLSPGMRQALEETVADGSQALLFLNRRGYAPLTLCRSCGHRIGCPNCSAWLIEHRLTHRLQCHFCGYGTSLLDRCPACDAEDSLVACGPGVERLAEEVEEVLPGARYIIATSDTVSGPNAAAELVRRIEEHEIDIIIGTQIVAKGYHFPLLTMVGVVDADIGLAGGDLRAAERTYQLLYQVAGRAGRAERSGRVLLQTYMPEHPVIAALSSCDRQRFVAAETEARREARMPPFTRLVAVIVSGREAAATEAAARALGRAAPRQGDVRVLGPAPAALALLRGRYRYRLLLKAAKQENAPKLVSQWLNSVRLPGSVRVQVDVDPYNFV